MKKLIFQTGGPFHPVAAQAKVIQSWIPNDWILEPAFGADAFEKLTDADLYVAAGLHWTGLDDISSLIGSAPEPPIWASATHLWQVLGMASQIRQRANDLWLRHSWFGCLLRHSWLGSNDL